MSRATQATRSPFRTLSPRRRRTGSGKRCPELPANREQDASGVRRESGQADRLISTSPLNTLLCLHAWPINVVVFDEPDGEN